MSKQLPQPKKTLKSFILEDDAKITDKTAAKITITTAFLAINIAAASQDANAKGHSNHNSHQNNLNVDNDYGTGYHVGNNPTEVDINSIGDKTVLSAHGNHYNHSDGGGGQGGLLGMAIGFAIAFMIPGGILALGTTATTTAVALGGTAILGGTAAITLTASTIATTLGTSFAGEVIGSVVGGDGEHLNSIDTGTPNTVPAPIINALREEEQS